MFITLLFVRPFMDGTFSSTSFNDPERIKLSVTVDINPLFNIHTSRSNEVCNEKYFIEYILIQTRFG